MNYKQLSTLYSIKEKLVVEAQALLNERNRIDRCDEEIKREQADINAANAQLDQEFTRYKFDRANSSSSQASFLKKKNAGQEKELTIKEKSQEAKTERRINKDVVNNLAKGFELEDRKRKLSEQQQQLKQKSLELDYAEQRLSLYLTMWCDQETALRENTPLFGQIKRQRTEQNL